MSKKTLVVLFGGLSAEHDVSCVSAATVLRHADKETYTVLSVGISKKGRWFLYESDDYDAVENGS